MWTKWIASGTLVGLSILGFVACGSEDRGESGEQTESVELEQRGRLCGGFANLRCPPGFRCVDDPSDDCDPARYGRDCSGICVRGPRPPPQRCNYRDPFRRYVSRDPEECKVLFFSCAQGKPFFNECGCGCEVRLEDPGERCGRAICGPGEYCCNESCSICAPEGGFCTQQRCE
jgi:hypothetical protein